MKKTNSTVKTIMIAALGLSLAGGVASCKKGCTDASATNYDSKAKKDDGSCIHAATGYESKLNDGSQTVLNADITSNVTLPGKEYTLSGGVHVKSGATLTIPAGATFKSDPNESIAYLLIEKGAKIMAEGTETSPIVFTSGTSTPKRGDWGGIILCGNAPVNGGSRTAEVGNVTYGGTDAADNSGILKYIRLEYTGNAINAEKEHNGFSFNGCGTGTVAEYLQVFMGGDDGFEWFGGTMNANYLISTGSKDDSFDWTYGWSGSGTNWYANQATDEGDRGIEGDNDSKNNSNSPYSSPNLSNVTLKGRGASAGTDGMKLREGTKGLFTNVKIMDFKDGIEVEHSQTCSNAAGGSLKLTDVTISGASKDWAVKSPANATDSVAAAGMLNTGVNGNGTGSADFWTGKSWVKSL
ncbi:MAG: hypothetical protein CL840_08335 [Crocinitomicaceae bacterium]|nr:hypothetical protein [Crocinitomicaceae bacterium]|tara:strand:+ start:4551 stop:5780 length:1230 start_codon:yes stop_codon:yes gene_type:complete